LSPKTIEKAEFKLYSQKACLGGVVLEGMQASRAGTKKGEGASKPRVFLSLGR
jgi:hypothetical protein